MRTRTIISLYGLLVSLTASGQHSSGSISGTVTDFNGAVVDDAPLRLLNGTEGTGARAYTLRNGRYTFENLPAGSYTVSVAMPCCAFANYTSDVIVLSIGEALELDIRLEESGNLIALADDPGGIAAEVRGRQIVPNIPVPRTREGRPDLSGVWLVSDDPFPEEPDALAWAEEVAEKRNENDIQNDPVSQCLPAELPIPAGSIPIIAKFVQTPDLLVMLFEGAPGFRQIFLDGRDHPEDPNPTWLGHSVGRWDEDTLVVTTTGFNSRGLNGAYPRTEKMRLEERYKRDQYGRMELQMTIEDAGVFAKPWVQHLRFHLAPQEDLIEFVCENNKWIDR